MQYRLALRLSPALDTMRKKSRPQSLSVMQAVVSYKIGIKVFTDGEDAVTPLAHQQTIPIRKPIRKWSGGVLAASKNNDKKYRCK